jgi:hypothetical protein
MGLDCEFAGSGVQVVGVALAVDDGNDGDSFDGGEVEDEPCAEGEMDRESAVFFWLFPSGCAESAHEGRLAEELGCSFEGFEEAVGHVGAAVLEEINPFALDIAGCFGGASWAWGH